MSIFSKLTHYDRPGPGVEKDGPKKPRIVLFFEIFFRKFFNLIKVNLLCLVPIIPVALIIAILNFLGVEMIFLLFIPVILLFPCMAGLTYITRNYAREEHAFITSDFIDAVKANWKQFLIHGVITYAAFCLFWLAFNFYYTYMQTNSFYYIPFFLVFLLSVILLFMQFYIPVMIVTFDLKITQIYKNAMIFVFVGAPRNFLLLLIFAIMAFLTFILWNLMPLTAIFIVILWLFIAFSFISILINFTIYPLIEKFMIIPYYSKSEEEKGEEAKDPAAQTTPPSSETLENGDTKTADKADKVEYVYENGKLIRKSEVEAIFEDNLNRTQDKK